MIQINIPIDFTDSPSLRYRTDVRGEFSGEAFYEELLQPKFKEAVASGEKLKIILDGAVGYASSFLNEAFGKLSEDWSSSSMTKEDIWAKLDIVSEVSMYTDFIKAAIFNKRSKQKK